MTEEQAKALRAPFPRELVGKLPKPTGKSNPKGHCRECGGYHGLPAAHIDFVGHAAVTDRLLQVDREWSWAPMAVDANGLPLLDKDEGLWITLTVCGHSRPGYGTETSGAKMKEIIGDAIRNAAMRFGVALDLWSKEDLSGHEDDEGGEGNGDSPITDAHLQVLRDWITDTNTREEAFLRWLQVEKLEHLEDARYSAALAALKAKKAQAAK